MIFIFIFYLFNSDFQEDTDWKKALIYKVHALQYSPYLKTFFIDTDTYFLDNCNEFFQLLNYSDLLIAQAPSDSSHLIINGEKINGYHPYNAGVIIFNNNEMIRKLFIDWLKFYKTKYHFLPTDQTPFMESLLINKAYIYVLQSIYNFRLPFYVSILPDLKVKIIHGRCSNYEILGQEINRTLNQKSWNPEMKKINSKTI